MKKGDPFLFKGQIEDELVLLAMPPRNAHLFRGCCKEGFQLSFRIDSSQCQTRHTVFLAYDMSKTNCAVLLYKF